MRFVAVAVATALVAGCTVEVVRPGTTVSTTVPGGSPRPAATTKPQPAASAAASPKPAASLAPDAVVLRIDESGGMCVGAPCGSSLEFRADGTFTYPAGYYEGRGGQVAPTLVAALLAEERRADFAAIKARKFTGACPTWLDGSETTYTFVRPAGDEVLPWCTYDLAGLPLIAAADALDRAADAVLAAQASPTPAPASPMPTPTIGPDDTILVLRRAGGRCTYGLCETTTTVMADGRYVWTQGANERREGKVDQALAAALSVEIYEADFAALKARPFTGTCPPAYDGQEVTYTFGSPLGDQVLAGCTYALDEDQPIFKAALALEAAARP